MIKGNKEVTAVKSRKRRSPQISLNLTNVPKKIKKKSVKKKTNLLGLEKTLLQKYDYDVSNSESERKRSLGNAVIVYDPRGLYEELQTLLLKNKSDIKIQQIIKKDAEFVKQTYFKLLKK